MPLAVQAEQLAIASLRRIIMASDLDQNPSLVRDCGVQKLVGGLQVLTVDLSLE